GTRSDCCHRRSEIRPGSVCETALAFSLYANENKKATRQNVTVLAASVPLLRRLASSVLGFLGIAVTVAGRSAVRVVPTYRDVAPTQACVPDREAKRRIKKLSLAKTKPFNPYD